MKCKKIICPLFVCLLCFCFVFSIRAQAAGISGEFSMPDVETPKGRLFEISIDCCASGRVSAFVAEIAFDEDYIEYRDAKAADENAQISVNSSKSGKITIVYFCEEGTECSQSRELVKITFKAKEKGVTMLSFEVSQAITEEPCPIAVSGKKNAQVNITKSESSKSAVSGEKEQNTVSEESSSRAQGVTIIEGSSFDVKTIVMLSLSFVTALCIAVIITYKVALKKAEKRKKKEIVCDFPSMEISGNSDVV